MRRRPAPALLEPLQWFGLFGGGLAWAAHLVLSFGLTVADCSSAGSRWGLDRGTWEVSTTVAAAVVVVAALAASAVVFSATQGVDHSAAPPEGRWRLFATGGLVANVLFLAGVLLTGLTMLTHDPCRSA